MWRIERIKQMQLLLATAIAFCCVAVSCSNEAEPANSKEITLGVNSVATARASVTTKANLDSIGVLGYYTATERWVWSSANAPASLTPNYFFNKSVKKTATNTWTYSPLKYWPPDTRNKISFFAYAPWTDPTTGNLTLYPTTNTDAGAPYLTYIPAPLAADHIDLLWASRIDMCKDDAPVVFDMNHALTRISFSAALHPDEVSASPKKNYSVRVKEITVSGVHGYGTMMLVNGAWTPYTPAGNSKSEYILTLDQGSPASSDIEDVLFNATTDNGTSRILTKAGRYLMLIPQTMEDDASLNFVLEITTNVTVESGLSVSLKAATPTWIAGQAIDYQILIKGEFISLVTNLYPWQPEDATGSLNF